MEYNTTRPKLLLPEYGRNVQQMIAHAMEIADRDERNKAARAIIEVMGIDQYRANFKNCSHNWELHVDVESTGGPAKGNTVFLCSACGTVITMLEKNSLDSFLTQKEFLNLQEKMVKESLISQKESQEIQEKSLRISMWANIIATFTVLIAFIVLLFGEGLFK